ncbi:hypothetical protein DFH09DRAFT_140911 [Mycena vulgaris]|nr:hypothetical protein DFH09DRAFT_140911 [Mycena vulgaris]
MSSSVAIVDEKDALVHYAGSWNDAGSAAEFNGTTTWSAVQGSTVSFTFVGTSIGVFGTVAAKNPPQSSLTFLVDNSIQGTYTPPANMLADIHHEELWASPTLGSGSHTLVITQSAAQALGVIFLDYFMFNTTSTSIKSYFIDDRDARVTYTPEWRKFIGDNDFMHTSQESTSPGDSFSLKFEGTSVSYYGGITASDAGVMNASIVLDGGKPTFFIAPASPAAVTNNLIFESGIINDGSHTLVITQENQFTVWTDYFLITPGTASAASSTPSPSTTSGSGSDTTGESSKKSTPIGAIVGPVIGIVLLIALAAAAFILCRRRKRRREFEPADLPMALAPAPFSDLTPTPFSDIGTGAATASTSTFAYSALAPPPGGTTPGSTASNYSALAASDAHLAPRSGASTGYTPPSPPPPPIPPLVPMRSNKLAQEATRWTGPPTSSSRSGPSSAAGSSSPPGEELPPPQYSE